MTWKKITHCGDLSPRHLMYDDLKTTTQFHKQWIEGEINPKALNLNNRVYSTFEFDNGVKMGIEPGILDHWNGKTLINDEPSDPMFSTNLIIHLIHTPANQRSKGYANSALKHVVELADKHRVTLQLEPSPVMQEKGIKQPDKDQLVSWYSKFGFEPVNNSFIIMQRNPK